MRLPLNRILRKITGFRLGYNVQRDLDLPIFACADLLTKGLEVPLTAYDIVQEYTYTPNATIPPLPFSYLIPSFLKSPLPDFSPQTLHVGDVFQLNDSTEEYNITSLANGGDSFLFYNNPLTSCDVQNVTMQIPTNAYFPTPAFMSADISCWVPVPFSLHWEAKMLDDFSDDAAQVMYMCWFPKFEIVDSCDTDNSEIPLSFNITEWTTTAYPHCPGSSLESAGWEDHLPCNSDPIDFAIVDETLTMWIDTLAPFIECASVYELTKENVFQGVYHYIRRDLGIHSPNQIWASRAMFNKTIQAISTTEHPSLSWQANELRSNYSAWTPWDMEHDECVKTPQIFYSRWTYRRKSLGSAITNVFVATFTMLAAIWKLFSFIAGLVISKGVLLPLCMDRTLTASQRMI
ncbi:hypothetical protein BDZ89DRAFT_1048151 [Hymenopellis radicata]|nr:hypothetical protein BDZ89DRAFT_1048151 [Hymenopellis radicata]